MDLDIRVDASEAINDFQAINRRMTMGYLAPLTRGAALLSADFAKNFFSGGVVVGWDPLDKDTVEWKAREGFPPAPLVETGRLAAATSSLLGPPSRIEMRKAVLTVDVDYAGFHQFGTRNMPSRQIVYVPAGFAAEMTDMIDNHLLKSFGGRAR